MNTNLQNKLSMWMVLRDFLRGNTATTDPLPGFATLFVLLNGTVEQVLVIMNALGTDTKGNAGEKRLTREQLVLKATELAAIMRAYAVMEGNARLQQQMNISKSSLAVLSDSSLLASTQEIYNKALELAGAIKEYGGTQEMIETLQGLITQYMLLIPAPRTAIDEHKHTQEELLAVMQAGDTTVDKMDALVETIRFANPLFYSDYYTRRKIIKTGHRTRSLQLWVVDDESGEPLAKANVTVKAKAGSELWKSVKNTGEQGGTFINDLDAGEYLYEVAIGGYSTATGSFFINDGIMTEVIVRLKK